LQPFLCDVDGLHSLKISAWKWNPVIKTSS
jgi:hypothetical protein